MTENQTIKERLIHYIKYLKIGQAKFETKCGLSNGYVNNIRKSISPDKLQTIALHNPDLNTGWLMTGEGDMLKSTYQQSVDKGKNFTQTGNVTVNNSDVALLKAIDEISAQRMMVQKAQEQIDRLITLLEKK